MSQSQCSLNAAPSRLRVAGHFGELMQGRLGPDGPLALISLPCPALWVECAAGLRSATPLISPERLDALCQTLALPRPDEPPGLWPTMPPGGGAGSSTAGLVALARALGFRGAPETLALACTQVEGASDPLMFENAERLLFAPREGRVLRPLFALPAFEVIGGFFGPVQRTEPQDHDFPDIADLVAAWQPGLSLAALAALTSQSARRTLALRGPHPDPTEGLARQLGADGWMIAHTGNARGLIFASGLVPQGAADALRRAGFASVVQFSAGGDT